MTARWIALAALVLTPSSLSCTLLYLFNSDPEGLPCDFSVDVNGDGAIDQSDGRCLQDFEGVDYACVEGVCLRARALQAGEACSDSAQCDEDLVCATQYAQCSADASDDVNCALVGEEAEQLACRPVCDLSDPQQCPADNRCFGVENVPGVNGFCQEGTCATDSDCQTIGGSAGLCVNEIGGKTGLCFELCDPFQCDETAAGPRCSDCNGIDGTPEAGLSCFPPPDEIVLSTRLVCLPFGSLPPFADCGQPGQDLCGFNTFCFNNGTRAYCAPFCRAPAGAPACDRGECTQIGGDLGFCAL